MRHALLLAGLLAALGARCGASAAGSASLGPASDFSLRTIEGDTFRLGDHLGRDVIVLSFWTTFCPSCRNELAQLQGLYEELGSDGLVVVAVSLDPPETVADVRPAAERLGFTFPVVIDEESRVAGLYNPRAATPFTVMIDGRGRRVWAHEGYLPGDAEDVEARIRGLLADRTGPGAPGAGDAGSGDGP